MTEKEKKELKDALLLAITAAKEVNQETGFVFASEDITKIALSVYIDRGKNGRISKMNGYKEAVRAARSAPKPEMPEAPAQDKRGKLISRLYYLGRQFVGGDASDEQLTGFLHKWLKTDSIKNLTDEQLDQANRLLYTEIKKKPKPAPKAPEPKAQQEARQVPEEW